MTDCYYYKIINESDKPILKNLELTVILVMEGSKRFKENDLILNLAKKTIIQYNKGFKTCPKICGSQKIDVSWKDLNYSNLTAFNNFKKDYNNVLILEEDAEPFNKNITVENLNEIDNYILNKDFVPISLGSYCLFTPSSNNKCIKSCLTKNIFAAQAIIWNLNNIETFIHKIITTECSEGHWDEIYIKSCDIRVFYKPIIVQKFPSTENQKTWNNNKVGKYLQEKLFDAYDTENKTDIWKLFYFLNNEWFIIVILILILYLYFINCKK